jgi:hypothetical protein
VRLFRRLALLMACLGLYGTTAYTVARSTGEISIRMALCATRRHVVDGLAGSGSAMYSLGLAPTKPLVKSFLFGVEPNDPLAIGVSAAILVACALLAGYLRAFRASCIDPEVALRNE